MALIKPKTRKKLSKILAKLVKRHGPGKALTLVSGMVAGLAAERAEAPGSRTRARGSKRSPPRKRTPSRPPR